MAYNQTQLLIIHSNTLHMERYSCDLYIVKIARRF